MDPRTLAVMFAVVVGIVCPVRSDEPKPVWKDYTSRDGRFTIKMPNDPTTQTQETKSKTGTLKIHLVAAAPSESSACLVTYNDYPDEELKAGVEKLYDTTRDGNVKNFGKLLSEKKVELGPDKIPGREILLRSSDGEATYRNRMFLVKNRFYQVVIYGADNYAKSKEADEYLDSFRLK